MPALFHTRRPIATLLTVWMAVVGVGVSVSHAHADGGSQHVHGLGWTVCDCPGMADEGHGGPSGTHRHLILLGIECPGESTPDSVPPAVNLTKPVLDLPCDVSVVDEAKTSIDLPPPTVADTVRLINSVSRFPGRFPSSAPLSAFALHTVTGVLRT